MYYIAVIFALGIWNVSAQTHECRPRDCYDLSCYGLSEGKDGPHTIYPVNPNLIPVNVSCDQETAGGGWIMYQRRVDGTLNFKRTWHEYKHGFGDNGGNTTELWLGNENAYQLVKSYGIKGATLRIEVDAFDGVHGWIESFNVLLEGENLLYRIYWKGCRASKTSMRDDWNRHKAQTFKTFDMIGGLWACLLYFKGGWWYTKQGGCGNVLMNGEYISSAEQKVTSIFVRSFKNEALQRSRMMFRETQPVHACNNPCKNNATCVHVANPRSHRCVCKTGFCGLKCELRNPCKNGGTCEYDKTTNSITCKCSAVFMGPTCEWPRPTTPKMLPTTPSTTVQPITPPTTQPTTPPTMQPTSLPTKPPTIIMLVVGGIVLLLLLFGIGLAVGVAYERRQRKKRDAKRERAKQERSARHSEAESFQDTMISMIGLRRNTSSI